MNPVYNYDYISTVDIAAFEAAEGFKHFVERELGVHVYRDAVVAPLKGDSGGVYADDIPITGTRFWCDAKGSVPIVEKYEDTDVFYLGMFYGCWGHCITDDLVLLWPIVKGMARGKKLIYTTSSIDEKLPKSLFELLECLGVDLSRAECIVKPTRFRSVMCAEPSMWMDYQRNGRVYTAEFVETIDALRNCAKEITGSPKKVYFSRVSWRSGKPDFGEKLIAQAFLSKGGCQSVSPEKLSFKDQLNLFHGLDTLVTTEGSIAHNALFMREGAEVVILRKARYLNDYQFMINQIRGLRVTYIDAFRDEFLALPREPWRGPFFLYINERLARYLGCATQLQVGQYVMYMLAYAKMKARQLASMFKRVMKRVLSHG